jgi:hypothetical protein
MEESKINQKSKKFTPLGFLYCSDSIIIVRVKCPNFRSKKFSQQK